MAATTPSQATRGELPADLESVICAEMRRTQVPGLAICAFDADGVRFVGAFGSADIKRGEAVSSSTVFRAASISKLVAATCILRLVDQGSLDLDTDVREYLQPAHYIRASDGAATAEVTLRQLLSHNSGLPGSARGVQAVNPVMNAFAGGRNAGSGLGELVKGLRLAYEPGSRIVYANDGFSLLGQVVAETTGETYEAAAAELVLKPVGMDVSELAAILRGPGVATPHGPIALGGALKPAEPLRVHATPMGGLYTTVTDLARLGGMLLRGGLAGSPDSRARILDEATVDEAFSMQVRNQPDLDEGYGLGFISRAWRGCRLVGHDGNMPGVANRFVMLPEVGVGIAVLTNAGAMPTTYRVAQRGLEVLLGLDPEPEPGSPAGITTGMDEWQALTARACGRWHVLDYATSRFLDTMTRIAMPIHITHVGDGRLCLESRMFVGEPAWLYPDGEPGRYRLAFPVGAGTRAVIEDTPDGLDLWWGTLHFRKG